MYHLELMCTKRNLLYKKYAKTAVFPRILSYPLFATVMEIVSTFFADQYCT